MKRLRTITVGALYFAVSAPSNSWGDTTMSERQQCLFPPLVLSHFVRLKILQCVIMTNWLGLASHVRPSSRILSVESLNVLHVFQEKRKKKLQLNCFQPPALSLSVVVVVVAVVKLKNCSTLEVRKLRIITCWFP